MTFVYAPGCLILSSPRVQNLIRACIQNIIWLAGWLAVPSALAGWLKHYSDWLAGWLHPLAGWLAG